MEGKERRVSIKRVKKLLPWIKVDTRKQPHKPFYVRAGVVLGLMVWIIFWFYATQFALAILLQGIELLGVSFKDYNQFVLQTVLTALVYIATIALVIYLPWRFLGRPTTKKNMGLEQSLPTWRDVGLAPVVYVATLLMASISILYLQKLFPQIDFMQRQAVGFDAATITHRYELILVYITLGVIAPISEELLFRGYLFGKIRRHASTSVTIILTAIVFSAMHLGLGQLESLQWNVAIATLLLGLSLGCLRAATKSVWAGIILHMIQNSIAFLALFALPTALRLGL